jgi:predicted PurR-regulated permease PerM
MNVGYVGLHAYHYLCSILAGAGCFGIVGLGKQVSSY